MLLLDAINLFKVSVSYVRAFTLIHIWAHLFTAKTRNGKPEGIKTCENISKKCKDTGDAVPTISFFDKTYTNPVLQVNFIDINKDNQLDQPSDRLAISFLVI